MIVLGRLALYLALVFSLAGVVFLAYGVRTRRAEFIRNGYFAVYGFFFSVVVASAVLLSAFVKGDFSFQYVADNSATGLSLFYRVAGFWAGAQGSFLLWLLFLAIVATVIALRNIERSDRLTGGAVMVLMVISGFFSVLLVADHASNPFVGAGASSGGMGLNPLLLHPAMVLHPPSLFLGYVGLAVPFAFAVSALLVGRADREWVELSQKWTIAGWAMLSLGIGLGAWWAYTVLSWGGYWGWDPVENTSLIPWLTATALLHSMNLYRKRGIFKHWTVALAGGTFWLTILATWTTRTGLVTSVHAFERNTTMIWILTGLLITVAAVTIGLLAWRWRTLESELPLESLASRDFLYYATNVTLSVFAAALVFATVVVPLVGDGRSIAGHTYDLFARPLGVVVLGGIALCPLLSWGRTEGRTLWKNVRWPLAAGAVALIVMIVTGAGRSSVGGMIGLTVCVTAGAAVVMFVVTTARRAAGAGGAGAGWRRALFGSRTRSAAFVAHFGMVLVVAGLIGSNVYKSEASAYIAAKPGATAAIGGYTLKYVSMRPASGPQGSSQTYALFDVYRGGKLVGTVEPHSDIYPVAGAVAQASILGGFGHDLFVVVQDPFDQSSKHLRLQLDLFPLIRLVWIGSLLLVGGAGVSLWPRRQPATVLATAAEEGGEAA